MQEQKSELSSLAKLIVVICALACTRRRQFMFVLVLKTGISCKIVSIQATILVFLYFWFCGNHKS